VEVASQFAFDQSRSADYAAAAQIALGREMYIAASPYRPAEAAADFVITEIDVSAAGRANGRRRRAADLLFSLALKTLDHRGALPFPKIFKFLEN